MLRYPVVLLSMLLSTSLLSGQEKSVAPPIPGPGDPITAEEVRTHVKYLAGDELHGRFSGSEDEEKVLTYIAGEFKTYGLKPPIDGNGFLQKFPLPASRSIGKGTTLVLHTASDKKEFRLGDDFSPIGVGGKGSGKAPVVFAGFGITDPDRKYDDYAGIDVKGRVVLIMRHAPRENDDDGFDTYHALFSTKAENAEQHGASALLVVTDPIHHQGEEDALVGLGEGGQVADIPVLHIKREVADLLLESSGKTLADVQKVIEENKQPSSFSIEGFAMEFVLNLDQVEKTSANVLGFLEGADANLRREIVVIGGHHDHVGLGEMGSMEMGSKAIHNGADDNASGTAGVLELAEAFARLKDRPKRSILFMTFGAEEQGLIGSRYYVNHPVFPLKETVMMLNMDMIGRSKENRLSVSGVGTSPGLQELVDGLNARHGLAVSFGKGGAGPTDSASFYYKDIPVLFFFSGFHEDYHRPSDDWEKINVEGEAKILRLVFDIAWRLANIEGKIEFRSTHGEADMEQAHSAMGSGTGVYLGLIPKSYEDTDGAHIDGAAKGSPAEKAGLKKGDIIIGFNGKTVRGFRDLSDVLFKRKPGDVVTIKVLRDGKEVELTATLGKR